MIGQRQITKKTRIPYQCQTCLNLATHFLRQTVPHLPVPVRVRTTGGPPQLRHNMKLQQIWFWRKGLIGMDWWTRSSRMKKENPLVMTEARNARFPS